MVLAAPVDAVRLEGVAAIGAEDDRPTSGPEHPRHFPDRRPVVMDVLNNLVAQYEVERPAGKRQPLRSCVQDFR